MDWNELKEMAKSTKGQAVIVSIVFALVVAAGYTWEKEAIAQVVYWVMDLFS